MEEQLWQTLFGKAAYSPARLAARLREIADSLELQEKQHPFKKRRRGDQREWRADLRRFVGRQPDAHSNDGSTAGHSCNFHSLHLS